jgi:hypothetical protein
MTWRRFTSVWLALLACFGITVSARLAHAQQAGGGVTGGAGGASGGGGVGSGTSLLSGGSTFTGGSGGMTGSGAGTGFSGGQGGYTGNTAGPSTARIGTGGSAASIPAKSNVFGGNYANPFSLGIASTGGGTPKASFGQPLYATATTTARSSQNTSRLNSATGNAAVGFTTYGTYRDPPYSTDIHEDIAVVAKGSQALQAELRGVIARSSVLKSKTGITVAVEQGRVMLRGEVASERERRLVESIVRLTPGVRDVGNELTVAANGKP